MRGDREGIGGGVMEPRQGVAPRVRGKGTDAHRWTESGGCSPACAGQGLEESGHILR